MRAEPTKADRPGPDVAIDFEGRSVPAKAGEPVGVALWRAGERILGRSVKYHRPRGLQCMVGHCGSCLVRIDGVPSRFACTTPCADGMLVTRQNAFPSASHDALRVVDWAFPSTFNHHEMFARLPLAREAMAKIAHRLAGLGELPDARGAAFAPAEDISVRTLLIGLGRAGRLQTDDLGPQDLVIDDSLGQLPGRAAARTPASPPVGFWRARAIGLYVEDGRALVATRRASTDRSDSPLDRLCIVRAERIRLACGSRVQIPPFEGADLPGVITDAAAAALLRWKVMPAARAMAVGDGARVKSIAQSMRAAGVDVTEAPSLPRGLRAIGADRLRGTEIGAQGRERAWHGDLLVVAGPLAPAYELGAQAGARLSPMAGGGFAVQTDAEGRSSVPWLAAFGSCAAAAAASP